MEGLKSFGLPPTFPAHLVPEGAARFVADSHKGMTKDELIALATERGYDPLWKALPQCGHGVYGLGLIVDGMSVPFMVQMIEQTEH